MLITSLLPLLSRYSLGFDLIAAPNGEVTLTIFPRKAEGGGRNLDTSEVRPISIVAPAAEIDAELAKGEAGALGQLLATRKALGDQLQEQHEAAEAAKAKAKATPAPAAKAAVQKPTPTPAPAPAASAPAPAKPGEPASLW